MGEMLRIRRKPMGIRDVCVPGGGTPPLRYPREVVWIRRGVVRGWEVVLRQSLSQKSKIFDSSLYTREDRLQ